MPVIHCPSCQTGYNLPGPCGGRMLRCARCRTEWTAPADEPVADIEAAAEPEPEPVSLAAVPVPPEPEPPMAIPEAAEAMAPVRQRRRPDRIGMALAGCWMLSLATLGGGGFAALHWRDAIGHHWPPAQRVYALLSVSAAG